MRNGKLLALLTILAVVAALPASAASRAYIHDDVLDQLQQTGQARVIVSLSDPALPQARAFDFAQRIPAVRDMTRRVRAAAPGFEVSRTYRVFPFLAGTVDAASLEQLAASPLVAEIYPDRILKAALNASGPLIGQPAAQAAGYDGAGVAIAIFDTGIDYKHSDFGGTSTTTFPSAKVVGGYDFIDNDPDPMDKNGHGTHVAGIAAGADSTYRGIAPAAKLVAYRVLDAYGYGTESGIAAALDYMVAPPDGGGPSPQEQFNIKVANLSIGDQYHYSAPADCDNAPSISPQVFADVVAHGVVVVAAAGNEGSIEGVGFPACLSSVIAVGATYDTFYVSQDWGSCQDASPLPDSIVCFSDRGELIDLYAPGAIITSANANLPTTPSGIWIAEAGTSMAAPHVAGAAACLAGKGITDPAAIRQRLRLTGVQIVDPDSHVATPRVDIEAAMTAPTTGPDLIISSLSVPVASAFPGDTFSVSLTIQNQGTTASSASTALALLSANNIVTPHDDVLATIPVPALASGESYVVSSLGVTIPFVEAGGYSLGAYADSSYLVSEKDEINNGLGSPIAIGSCARVVTTSIPAYMRKGQTYGVSVTMRNDGTVPWTSAAGFELAAASPQDTSLWGISRIPLPGSATVNPGATTSFTFNVTAPSQPGRYPCHWQMATGNHFFGEKATGAEKILVADDDYWGQSFPSVSGNRVAYEDWRGYGWYPFYIADISVTDLTTLATAALPHDIQLPLDSYGYPLPPYEWIDLSYHWWPTISGSWVVWMTDDVPDPDYYFWYFQIIAYNLATPWVMPVRVTYNPADPWEGWMPCIDGTRVVWEDYRNDSDRWFSGDSDNADIYIADLSSPLGVGNTIATYPVCTAPGDQWEPRISGKLVVWEDWRDGIQSDIYLYDLSVDSDGDGIPNWKESLAGRPSPDPAEKRLTNSAYDERYPDVSGDTVVWLDLRRSDGSYSGADIYSLDVDTMVQTPAVTDPFALRLQPRIDAGNLVWSDRRFESFDIYWLNLPTGVTVPMALGPLYQDQPDISGRTVVYTQWRDYYVTNLYAQRMFTDAAVGVHTFPDVNSDQWAWAWIEAVAANDVVTGYPDGTYGPGITVSRDLMAVYIARAMGWISLTDDMTTAPELFSDVPAGFWAGTAVQACVANGVVQGYSDGTYRPLSAVTRDQMAVYIARAKGWVSLTDDMTTAPALFSDVPAGFWAGTAVQACVINGVVQGYSNGTYRPTNPVTRDQMAVYIARAFGYVS